MVNGNSVTADCSSPVIVTVKVVMVTTWNRDRMQCRSNRLHHISFGNVNGLSDASENNFDVFELFEEFTSKDGSRERIFIS